MGLINVTSNGCELAELKPYPAVSSTDSTVGVTPVVGPDGKTTYDLSSAASTDADWFASGTTDVPAAIGDDIWTGGKIGIGGVSVPLSGIHSDNSFSNGGGASAFGALVPTTTGFDDYSEYKHLMYKGATPQESYGIGVESGSLVTNAAKDTSSSYFANRFGGVPRWAVRGDGYIRAYEYGRGDTAVAAGTPSTVLMPDQYGWMRERPVTDGNPRASQALYGGGWLWGGWSPVHTDNVALTDRDWSLAHIIKVPEFAASWAGPAQSFDMTINANMGQMLEYKRECINRSLFGWRIKVDGVVVATRSSAIIHYDDKRTSLGDETINGYYYKPIGTWNYVRNNVPAGSTVEIEYRHRYSVSGAQTNAYSRVIAGVYREATATFASNKLISV